jgi:hypothetical protein
MKEARRCRLALPRRKLEVNYAEQAKRYADELAAKVFGHAAVDVAELSCRRSVVRLQ